MSGADIDSHVAVAYLEEVHVMMCLLVVAEACDWGQRVAGAVACCGLLPLEVAAAFLGDARFAEE